MNAQRYHQIEYDLKYFGGDYSDVGTFIYISENDVAKHGSAQAAFTAITGHDACHIICTYDDDRFTADGDEIDEKPTSHTATPFVASGTHIYATSIEGAPQVAQTSGLNSCKDILSKEEQEANARFIATACTLHGRFVELLQEAQRYCPIHVQDEIRAALVASGAPIVPPGGFQPLRKMSAEALLGQSRH